MIPGFKPFPGQHCETTATGSLLKSLGSELSEPMLFGLGEGLHFIFWNMKGMDIPFIGGRVKPDLLTINLCRNLDVSLRINETRSVSRAWAQVKQFIDAGVPVGLKLDAYHLEYFTRKFHFAGHYVAMYGYDEERAYLVDTMQQGSSSSTSLESLAAARNEKGPMSSPNRSYTISGTVQMNKVRLALLPAIRRNAENYLSAPITNLGYRGIAKTAREIRKWYDRSADPKSEFTRQAHMMEKAGTGGALFRNLYRDFLLEAAHLTQRDPLYLAHEQFEQIAADWKKVSDTFLKLADSGDPVFLKEAASLLLSLSEMERSCFEKLQKLSLQN